MNITAKFLAFTLLGATWVLWLLVALSVLSVAIMIERALFFARQSVDIDQLLATLRAKLRARDPRAALKWLEEGGRGSSMETAVARAGLEEIQRGPDAVGEAMVGAKAREKLGYQRYLVVLATLGNNAPFIGLFGTVIGIIKAFHDLAQNQAGGATAVMAGISEALVATAIGLIVALPAVVAHNIFHRRVQAALANTDAVAHLILGEVKGEPASAADAAE